MRALLYSTMVLMLAMPRAAQAVQTYPAEIQLHLGLSYTPPCTLCHATNVGGLGTVVTPFAKSMVAAGLSANFDSLDPALDQLAANNWDSNADGTPDIQQLKSGENPNTGEPLAGVEQQQFGCNTMRATKTPGWAARALLVGALLLIARARRAALKVVVPRLADSRINDVPGRNGKRGFPGTNSYGARVSAP